MSIKKDVVKGVFWIGLAKYSGVIVTIVISAVLARLISPKDFGTVAIATVILHFLSIFADIGFGTAIVQYQNIGKQQCDSLFTVSLYIGILLSIILIIGAPSIAEYYGDPILLQLCLILSIVLIFTAANTVPNALMRKEKRFKTIALRTLFFQVTSGIVSIVGAFYGWGVYALLVSPLVTSIGVFIVNFYNYPQRTVWTIDWDMIRGIGSYSMYQFAFVFCNYFSRNIDKLIVGKFFSLADLGYYEKSYKLMMMPMQNISYVVAPVLHPILSSLQDNLDDLRHKNEMVAKYLSWVSFPVALVLYFNAAELIRIVFGPDWDAAIPCFEILSLSVPLQIIQSTSSAFYQSAGKTKHMFYNGLSNTFFTVTAFFIAAIFFDSIEAMAWAWDISLLINFAVSYTIMYRLTFNAQLYTFIRILLPQLLNTFIVVTLCVVVFRCMYIYNILIAVIIKSGIIGISTFVVAYMIRQYNIGDYIIQQSKRIKK